MTSGTPEQIRSADTHIERPPPRGRPRSQTRRLAVLAATLDEIAERGIANMRVESVAERAGVSKVTIYRWWPDKIALALDALDQLPELTVPDTGSLEGDLQALRVAIVALIENTRLGDVLPAMIAARGRSEHREAIAGYVEQRSAPYRRVVDRAIARGELPHDLDPALVTHLFASPLSSSILLRDEPLDDEQWITTIRIIVAGLHARGQP